jgi:hypothetical protein
LSTSRDLRDKIAGKLGEYGRLRRTLLILAAIGAAASWIIGASAGQEPAPWVSAAQVFGLFVSGGVAAFFALFEDNSADLARTAQTLEDERDATQSDLAQSKRDFDALSEEYRYQIALYQFSRSIGELTDPFLDPHAPEALPDLRDRVGYLLDVLSQEKGTLFGVGDEKWAFNVYRWNAESERLEMLACRRWSRHSEEQAHRSWARGEGHAGLAFKQGTELVCGDANAPSVNGLITARGDQYRAYDRAAYVSFASLPIKLGDQKDPLGVLVATSDQKNRFVAEEEARSTGQRDTVEALRTVTDILATMIVVASR